MTIASVGANAFRTHVGGMPKKFWVLWWGHLGNRVGGMIRPFFAIYLTSARGLPVSEVGLMLSLVGVGGIGAQPVGGMLADRYGRRRVLTGSLVLAACSALALSQAHRLAVLAIFCVIQGFCADLYRPAANSAVADMIDDEERVRAYGLLFWAYNLGFAIGAVLGGVVANVSYSLIFYCDAATTLCFALLIYLRLPETQHESHRHAARERGGMRIVLRDRLLLSFVACIVANSTVYMQVDSTMAVVMHRHGISPGLYGAVIALNGVIIVLLQPWAITVTSRVARVPVMCSASVLMAVGFGLTRLCGGSALGYAATLAVWTFGEILQSGLFATTISDLAPAHLRGRYMGIFGSSFGASALLAPIVGTQVLAHGGETALWVGASNLMLCSAIGFALLEPRLRARGAAGPESRPALPRRAHALGPHAG